VENHFGGEVKNFDPVEYLGRREARRTDRVTQFALYVRPTSYGRLWLAGDGPKPLRHWVLVAAGLGVWGRCLRASRAILKRGPRRVSPLAVSMMLPDSSAAKISMFMDYAAPIIPSQQPAQPATTVLAKHSRPFAEARSLPFLAGSTEAALVDVTIASFNNMTAISRRNDEPERACARSTIDRDGFVCAEGSAVSGSGGSGTCTGAECEDISAEILGYGHTSDAYHVTAPLETARVQRQPWNWLSRCRYFAEGILTISTLMVRARSERHQRNIAIKRALGDQAYEIPISSTKSVTGPSNGWRWDR